MSIENPISTIRKAVSGISEDMASKEHFEKPEPKHFNATFEMLKMLKNSSPEMLEEVIIMAAKAKDLKNILGKELDPVFQKVWDEIYAKNKDEIIVGIEKLLQRKDLTLDQLNSEVTSLTKKKFDEMSVQMKSDSKINTAFSGKEAILYNAISFVKIEFPKFFEGFLK